MVLVLSVLVLVVFVLLVGCVDGVGGCGCGCYVADSVVGVVVIVGIAV